MRKLKTKLLRIMSVAIMMCLSINVIASADTLISNSEKELVNIIIIQDTIEVFETKAIYSNGDVEYVIVNKKQGEFEVVDQNYNELERGYVDDVIQIEGVEEVDEELENAPIGKMNRESYFWYQTGSSYRTNLEASYNRVSAVISLVMAVAKIPYAGGYAIVQQLYKVATGKPLPIVFGYISQKWEYSTTVYKDHYNSANGMVEYLYYFDNVYKGYNQAIFKW